MACRVRIGYAYPLYMPPTSQDDRLEGGTCPGAGAILKLINRSVVQRKGRAVMSTTTVCLWTVDDTPCGAPATGQVTIKDRISSMKVPVCDTHKAEHNRKAAQLRVKS